MPVDLTFLSNAVAELSAESPVGRVLAVQNSVIQVQGLLRQARIGDHVDIHRDSGNLLLGEILCIDGTHVQVLPHGAPHGVKSDDRVVLRQSPTFAPHASWVGRVLDPFGRPLDGKPAPIAGPARNLTAAPPEPQDRRPLGTRLQSPFAVFNTVLPIVQGQRIGLFAGSGLGKSQLLAKLATGLSADTVVIALIGERGREVGDFVYKTLGPEGLQRSVVIAATSDQSALTRRRCAWAAMTVAEHLRDCGQSVLFLADSITRFAEAHREIAVASGEAPALRGFPPSVSSAIMSLCERAGPGALGTGDITGVFSVLVAGSDMEEPVADILRGVLDGHVVLSREIAERGRYPAIDVLRSVSRSLPAAASSEENALIAELRALLGRYERSETMVRAGLYAEGSDALLDQAVRIWSELDGFLSREGPETIGDSFDRLALLLRRSRVGKDRSVP